MQDGTTAPRTAVSGALKATLPTYTTKNPPNTGDQLESPFAECTGHGNVDC